MYITGNNGKWEYVIGVEVHAQITSKSKLFSNASTAFGAAPNTQVSLIDAALPGMLPVLNEYCVHQAIKTGLGLQATINHYSVFDRKNYFYPDLPQGYQISQFYHPIVQNGSINITLEDGSTKTIRINRLHLEQDAGKSIHDQSPELSFIDLNRAGIALMEIVSEPEISSPLEAAEFIKKLRSILRYVGSCDGDMDKGSLRCDANVSVRLVGTKELGTRCEIKNLNSIKNIIKAIEYEGARQVELLENGEKVIQETRLFNVETGKTRTMRVKEDSEDYRYFPDPDLLPLVISDELIENLKKEIPELPDAKSKRYIEELYLSSYNASVIVSDEEVASYFEEAIKFGEPSMIANWLTSELFGLLNRNGESLKDCKITPSHLGKLTSLIKNETISGKIAKIVFEEMYKTGGEPEEIIKAKGLVQVSDTATLDKIIEEILSANPEMVMGYKSGKEKLLGFFVGLVMKKTGGKANPAIVNELLKKQLSNN